MKKSNSSRGIILTIFALIIAAGAAFLFMRNTLDGDHSPQGQAVRAGSSAEVSGQSGAHPGAAGNGNQGTGVQLPPLAPLPGTSDPADLLPNTTLPTRPANEAQPAVVPGISDQIPEQLSPQTQPSAPLPPQTPDQTPTRIPDDVPQKGLTSGQIQGQTSLQPPASPATPAPGSLPASALEASAPLAVEQPGSIGNPPASSAGAEGAAGDSMLLPSFVDDLARLMVASYWPQGTHPTATSSGISTLGVRSANLRYGSRPNGIRWVSADPFASRQAALTSIFTPSRLEFLSNLYLDRFIAALNRDARDYSRINPAAGRALRPAEIREMFRIYAARARGLAATLNAYADDPGIRAKVEKLALTQSAVHAANRDYLDSSAEFEAAREEKRPGLAELKALMDHDAAAYQQCIREREAAFQTLAGSLGRGLGEDSRVYCAFWAFRRGPQALPALRAAAAVLVTAADRLDAAAR